MADKDATCLPIQCRLRCAGALLPLTVSPDLSHGCLAWHRADGPFCSLFSHLRRGMRPDMGDRPRKVWRPVPPDLPRPCPHDFQPKGQRSRSCIPSTRRTKLTVSFPLPQKRVAVSLVLNCIPLATSPNGALLITWLVDASALPGRFRLLSSRFAPHLVHLCTHKLASTAVLRVINQRTDLDASRAVLAKIFSTPNDQVLIDILSDRESPVGCVRVSCHPLMASLCQLRRAQRSTA